MPRISLLSVAIVLGLLGPVGSPMAQPCDDNIPDHFAFVVGGGDSQVVTIDSTALICGLSECDEIGVFDGSLCVGAAVYEDAWPLVLVAWADDAVTPEVDGFTDGNQMTFRLWRVDPGHEETVETHFVVGDGTFSSGAAAQLWLSCCVTPEVPLAPMLSATTPCADSSYTVSWPSVAGVTSYRLYEADSIVYEGPDTAVVRSHSSGSFTYHLQACSDCNCSGEGPISAVAIQPPLPAPAQPSATPDLVCGGALYCVTWQGVFGATHYEVQENNQAWVDVGLTTQRCYVQDTAGTYQYRVRACDECGCGEASLASAVVVNSAPPQVELPVGSPNPACMGVPYCVSWSSLAEADYYEIREDSGVWSNVGAITEACYTQGDTGHSVYEVRACNECGCGEISQPLSVTIQLPPATPAIPSVSANPVCTGDEYCLSWDKLATASFYEVREMGGSWTNVGDTNQYCHSKVSPGNYSYQIRACNQCGCSGDSPVRTVVVQTTPVAPNTPQTSADPACLNQEFCLSWNAIGVAAYYELSENSGGWQNIGNVTQFCLAKDAPGAYIYRVRAGNSCGISGASPPRTVQVRTAAPVPGQPASTTNPACVGQGYCIFWAQVPGASSYEVRIDSGAWANVAGLTQSCYAQMVPGEYVYEVRACDDCACSEPSPSLIVAVEPVPGQPGPLSASDTVICAGGEFCLTWDTVSDATAYQIRDAGGLWFDLGDTNQTCLTQTQPGGYNYQVRACNDCGCSEASPERSIMVTPGVSPPLTIEAQPNPVCVNQQYCVTWSAVSGATNYQIREPGGLWTDLGDVTETCYMQTVVGDYQYEVRACDECGCSDPAETLTVTIGNQTGAPALPVIEPGQVCLDQEYCVSWNQVDGADSYELREDGGVWVDMGTDTSLCLSQGTTGERIYQVRACGECGCSDPSSAATAQVVTSPAQPPPATVSTDTTCVGTQFCLTWPHDPGAAYYEIREDGGVWLNAGDSGRYCFARSLEGDYWFVVRAVNDCGYSEQSDRTVITVVPGLPKPLAPTLVGAPVCVGLECCLEWDAVVGADAYQIRQGDNAWVDVGLTRQACFTQVAAGDYVYEVRACSPCGCTGPGPATVVTVKGLPTLAQAPSVVPTNPCVGQEFCLNWPAADDASVYHVSVDNGPWTSVSDFLQACFTIAEPSEHTYRVRACNDCGCGDAAAPVTVKAVPLPTEPALANCGVQGYYLRMEWQQSENADHYQVFRDDQSVMATLDTFVLMPMPDEQLHAYYIRGFNNCGGGDPSDICYIAGPTDVAEVDGDGLPSEYWLGQNYPNPFNPETQIEFGLPRASFVRLQIVNVLGRRVKLLIDASLSAGHKVVWWDGTSDQGQEVSSGVYFYHLQADHFRATRKMILLR